MNWKLQRNILGTENFDLRFLQRWALKLRSYGK